MELNSRELATIIWLVVFSIYLLFSSKSDAFAQGMKAILSIIFGRVIFSFLSLMLLYIGICIYLLIKVGLWDFSYLKSTLFWILSFALVSFFRINTIQHEEQYFRKTIRDNFRALVLVEFVVYFYTFNILIELILVPVITIITFFQAYTESRKDSIELNGCLGWIVAIFGLVILISVGYQVLGDHSELFSWNSLIDFLIPILLTLMYLPFVLFVLLYSAYESGFIVVSRNIESRIPMFIFKLFVIGIFRADRRKFKNWSVSVRNKLHSLSDVRKSISEYKLLRQLESTPIDIPRESGWPYFSAKRFLNSLGLKTREVQNLYGEYSCSSNYLSIGEGILEDNLAYYVEGTESVACRLKIILNVNKQNDPTEAHETFLTAAKKLYKRALFMELPKELEQNILKGIEFSHPEEFYSISLTREDFSVSKHKPYTLKFVIRLNSWKSKFEG